MKNKNPLNIPLKILIALFFLLIIIGYSMELDYLINVSVEILGSIVTLIVIDIYLSKNEKKIATKREQIIWTLVKPILRENLSVLFSMYKSTTTKRGANYKTEELSKFFTEDYAKTIQHLNIYSEAPIYPDAIWLNYLINKFTGLNNNYNSLLEKYSNQMEPELVELIEEIKNSSFHSNIISIMPTLINFTISNNMKVPKDFFSQVFDYEYCIKAYLTSINKIINLSAENEIMHNFFEIEDQIWREDVAPLIGSSKWN